MYIIAHLPKADWILVLYRDIHHRRQGRQRLLNKVVVALGDVRPVAARGMNQQNAHAL